MALTLAELRAGVRDELGDAESIILDASIDRWVNHGQQRLGHRTQGRATLTWNDEDDSIALPADFSYVEELVFTASDNSSLPKHRIWNGTLYPLDPTLVEAGSAVLFYRAVPPEITDAVDSSLSYLGDQALVIFAAHRFYKSLAGSRAEYRRYATITQANGVEISDLDALSERYLTEFEDIKDDIVEDRDLEPEPGASFFQD